MIELSNVADIASAIPLKTAAIAGATAFISSALTAGLPVFAEFVERNRPRFSIVVRLLEVFDAYQADEETGKINYVKIARDSISSILKEDEFTQADVDWAIGKALDLFSARAYQQKIEADKA